MEIEISVLVVNTVRREYGTQESFMIRRFDLLSKSSLDLFPYLEINGILFSKLILPQCKSRSHDSFVATLCPYKISQNGNGREECGLLIGVHNSALHRALGNLVTREDYILSTPLHLRIPCLQCVIGFVFCNHRASFRLKVGYG